MNTTLNVLAIKIISSLIESIMSWNVEVDVSEDCVYDIFADTANFSFMARLQKALNTPSCLEKLLSLLGLRPSTKSV